MDYEKIMRFLVDNRGSLIDVLRGERYRTTALATKYLDGPPGASSATTSLARWRP